MIKLISPRCVSLRPEGREAGMSQQFQVDDILSVESIEEKAGRVAIVLDLLSGQRVIAARYSDPGEAGADFGLLRILLGQTAWPEEWQAGPRDRPCSLPTRLRLPACGILARWGTTRRYLKTSC